MERDRVLDLYDEAYARAYDERFLLAAWPKEGADFEASVLRRVLGPDARWLDVGCGTGYFLSLFPEVERAGMDLSPSMLARARAANPGALFFVEGDFRDDVAEWHAAWSLVTCMWTAYNYVASVSEVEQLVANMVRWTRPGGACFIPVMDLEDLRYVEVDYEEDPDVWGGTIALTSVTWTWDEPGTFKRHEHLVAPQVGHFVRLLEDHFDHIEVVRYPVLTAGGIPRKAVLATGRRPPGATGTAEVTWNPKPRHPDDVAADAAQSRARGDEESRVRDEAQSRQADLNRELSQMRDELEALSSAVRDAVAPPNTVEDLSATSTRRLATEVGRRANPLRAGFWRRAARRLGR